VKSCISLGNSEFDFLGRILQVENNPVEDVGALSLFSLDDSEECQDDDEEGLQDRDLYET
jgi:hypothetical protein